ncbi:unnamed protein product [Pleuronectes platessa]|uniref:Uncharacterized protein n=1 Tax=Pleuronectes platessa TaxID=8262 RepID=A0A9N7U557_PLEPL|nr:unnamed protein product [Pleuronectes platessa]
MEKSGEKGRQPFQLRRTRWHAAGIKPVTFRQRHKRLIATPLKEKRQINRFDLRVAQSRHAHTQQCGRVTSRRHMANSSLLLVFVVLLVHRYDALVPAPSHGKGQWFRQRRYIKLFERLGVNL